MKNITEVRALLKKKLKVPCSARQHQAKAQPSLCERGHSVPGQAGLPLASLVSVPCF